MNDARGVPGPVGPAPTVRLVRPGAHRDRAFAAGPDEAEARTVTPNRRAARAVGAPAVSLEELARTLLRPLGLQYASELARWRALRRAVQDVWVPDDVDGTARVVAGTLREVLRAGLDEGRAAARERGAGPASSRLQRVLDLAGRYRDDLLGRGLVDPAEALWWVARGGPGGTRAPARLRLRVLGYPRIGAAEVAFLAAVCDGGSVLELPDGDDPVFRDNRAVAASLAAHGWRVERAGEGARAVERAGAPGAATTGIRRALRFASRDAEVRFALGEVKRLLAAGTPAEAIALVARDDAAYGPPLRAVAWEYGIPLSASYAVALRDTPIGAWTATLLEAVREGLPFEAVARLLAHPLAGGLAPAAWEAARAAHPRGADAWQLLDGRVAELAWPPSAPRAAWRERLRRAWRAYGVAEAVRSRPSDALALHRLDVAVEALGVPADEDVALGTFLHEVDALLSLLDVPADVGRTGVELHTPLAVYGARYAHVFVLGAAEGVLPRRIVDDPVLDFAERRAAAEAGLPLEGAVEAARREALSLRAVLWALDGAVEDATLTVSYAEDQGIASGIFERLGLTPVAPGRRAPGSPEEVRRRTLLASEDGGGDAVLVAARRAWAVERRREEAAAPDEHDGAVGEPYDVRRHVFSATQLLDLGQCAFRWLCKVPLGLAEPEEAEEDVSPLLRGRLYHRALELVLRAALGAAGVGATASALRGAALAALPDAFAQAETDERADAVPGWELRRAHHRERLERVLRSESFLPEGSEVLALERWFPARGEPPVLWRGFPVRGKVDRVDRRREGLVLLDYKTRGTKPAGAQDAHGKARVDLQLPLYLEAAAPALYGGEPAAGAQYFSLTKAEVLQEVRVDEGLDRAIDGVAAQAHARLSGGVYPVAPDVDLAACAVCDFDLVCRKGPRTERMRGAGAFDPPDVEGRVAGRGGATAAGGGPPAQPGEDA